MERGSVQGRSGERINDSSHYAVRPVASCRGGRRLYGVRRAHPLLRRKSNTQLYSILPFIWR